MSLRDKYIAHSTSTASRVVEGEAVVVMPMHSVINTFNNVGTRIWELADGSRTVDNIVEQIEQKFDITHKTAIDDTCTFVGDLLEKDMLSVKE